MIPSDLTAALSEAWEKATKVHPGVLLLREDYLEKIEQIVRRSPVELDPIKDLRLEDLFLATACEKGDEAAWQILMQRYGRLIQQTARACAPSHADADEVAQSIYGELYFQRADRPERPSKISTYNGRGSLQGWLRAVVARLSIDRARAREGEIPLEVVTEEGERQLHPQLQKLLRQKSLEPSVLWLEHVAKLNQSLNLALHGLSDQEKLLLQFYYEQNLTLKEIGVFFRVHEATVSRRLDAVRKKIRKRAEKALQSQWKLSRQELREFWEEAMDGMDQIGFDLGQALRPKAGSK